MIDLVSLLVGGVLVASGWLGGRVSRKRSMPSQPESICSCEHGYGSHADGGKCATQVERPHYWANGCRNGYEWVLCPCLSYDGPEPLPRVWTTEP